MSIADLYPLPFTTLVERLDRELSGDGLYMMPRREWWTPVDGLDTSLDHLGRRIATPAGPASGPHTQMAQNLVLSFLGGGRFMELKTVQVNDELEIPRPCIFVPHIGYNVEWSQELRVPQSAREYAAGWMLLHMLTSEHGPGLWGPDPATTFDVSVGYDLAGLRSDKVVEYLDTMRDASTLMASLRAQLPPRLQKWAGVEVPSQISDSVTISTFHGCPADEIEAIATQCLDWGWHTVVKLNPTLIGFDRCREMLDRMGYGGVTIQRGDFEKDLQWPQLMGMAQRLRAHAHTLGLGLGFKLTNTLVCHSDQTPFYPDKGGVGEMYLSGPPLHVISYTLASELRDALGPEVPLTFSAGVDRDNFTSCVAGGLGPVTSCSDLLKGRGYGRMTKYVRSLERAMKDKGVDCVDGLRLAMSPGCANAAEAGAAHLTQVASSLISDARYHHEANSKAPKKVGTSLGLLNCLTCDKCVPVCPNAANFAFSVPTGTHETGEVSWSDEGFTLVPSPPLIVEKRHQIGNFADVCNECGQCDPWCPEDGGPYLEKPTVFLDSSAYVDHGHRDGFHVSADHQTLLWRRDGQEYRYTKMDNADAVLETAGGRLTLREDRPFECTGHGCVQLDIPITMRLFLESWTDPKEISWVPFVTEKR